MYSVLPSFVLGFHGCDKTVAESVFGGKSRLKSYSNDYDWLGHGIYFWENNPSRALEFAKAVRKNPAMSKSVIKDPAVVGAVIDLGHCLNLLDTKNLAMIKETFNTLKKVSRNTDITLPQNKKIGSSKDFLLRRLDCAVIEMTHLFRDELVETGKAQYKFDSVRGLFVEGQKLYKDAGFNEKNHIQICVRNPNCIKGYFRVLEPVGDYNIP